ncbi:hypothetical protein P3T40_007654 [Paraburkholderia sp. EB58]|jgi:hypothetical protein|uniref:hypothetical protein n=1 Tax=Paraburkholderia sp. EB58 TaxID=3035125 RepID=UPI003D1D6E0A
MPIQYISDSRFNTIGSIETTARGERIAYSKNRERLGDFDPKANRTYDPRRRQVGTGDQLATLIASANLK